MQYSVQLHGGPAHGKLDHLPTANLEPALRSHPHGRLAQIWADVADPVSAGLRLAKFEEIFRKFLEIWTGAAIPIRTGLWAQLKILLGRFRRFEFGQIWMDVPILSASGQVCKSDDVHPVAIFAYVAIPGADIH